MSESRIAKLKREIAEIEAEADFVCEVCYSTDLIEDCAFCGETDSCIACGHCSHCGKGNAFWCEPEKPPSTFACPKFKFTVLIWQDGEETFVCRNCKTVYEIPEILSPYFD